MKLLKIATKRYASFCTAVLLLLSANISIFAEKPSAENEKGISSEISDISIVGSETVWRESQSVISFDFDCISDGDYNVRIVWKPEASGVNPTIGVTLDGEYTNSGLRSVELMREWKNISDKPNTDEQGNEYSPEQVETGKRITSILKDNTGVNEEPYVLHVTSGRHTLNLEGCGQTLLIYSITLTPFKNPQDYKEVSKNYRDTLTKADNIIIEGENASIKTSKSLIPKADNSNAGMYPVNAYKQKINFIGGTSWQSPGEELTWNFYVKNAGYYHISMRYKQSAVINGESYRRLKIDGEIPFKQAKQLSFGYCTGWEYYDFADKDSQPYLIWLDEGEHRLSLEATVGSDCGYIKRLSEITETLGNKYLDIVMITGDTPDVNTDYDIFTQIPDLREKLEESKEKMLSLANDMKKDSGNKSTQCIAAIENMARVLKNMLRNPYIAQQYFKDYYNNYTSVSSWLNDMKNMPLEIDRILLIPSGSKRNEKNPDFFESFSFGLKKLIISYSQDYNIVKGDTDSDKSIRLWVNWGSEQAAALSSIIADTFTRDTGINVKLEIVNASLVNGILAGNFPDVALHMARSEPVNLGIRGALSDLRQFEDCDKALSQFSKGAEIPYSYKDKLYALPDTQTFFIMFVRNDVMEKLGLEIPKTWDEFLHAAAIIQRNNMNVYVPYTQIAGTATVNAGIGSLNLLPTLFTQNGLSFYNEEKNATALTCEEAVEVFDKWTEFYTDYSFVKEADFYNRFRLGSMPLGIAPLATYMNLYAAAPEINGRWSVALVPGTTDENGNINRSIAGAGTGCAVIEKSPNKQEAWEFLKWWTDETAQSRFNNSVESILGVISRTATANIKAFESFAWKASDLQIIRSQRSFIKEIEEIPGSYYLTRGIDQAFWSVVNNESNSKDALVKWSKVADNEIERKIKEYS